MKKLLFFNTLLCLIMVFTPLICVSVKSNSKISNINSKKSVSVSTEKILSDKITEADIKDYIIGVVAAEMPASYETEALKAQAVSVYTYYRFIKENADNSGYITEGNGRVQQNCLTQQQMKEKWGRKFESYYKKIEEAVLSVSGECIMYEGEPIMAVTHSLSSGKTHSAEEIWGEDVPYLQSVTAVGDRLSPDFDAGAETAAVGMSRYSADYMARQGATYDEILRHFYTGVYIDKIL